jgi:hypothetical protein
MKKNSVVLLICILLVVAVTAIIVGVSLAIWRESSVRQATVIPTTQENPSLRFQLFHPLDSNDNLINFRLYDPQRDGAITYNRYTIDDSGERFYDLYETTDYVDYTVVDFTKSGEKELFVYVGQHEYDADDDGERYYEDYTSTGIQLYINSNGDPADKVVVGSVVSWYTYMNINDVPTLCALTLDPSDNQLYYDDTSVGCLECAVYTKSTPAKRFYYHNEETDDYIMADSDQVYAGENLFIREFSEYDPNSAADTLLYGTMTLSNRTATNQHLYLENMEGSYEYTELDDILLRNELYYTGDGGAHYAIASAEQVEAGVHLYMRNINYRYDAATSEQLSNARLRINLYYTADNGTSFAPATNKQLRAGEDIYVRSGDAYSIATPEQIAAALSIMRSSLYYTANGGVTYSLATDAQIIEGTDIYVRSVDIHYEAATPAQLTDSSYRSSLYYTADSGSTYTRATEEQIQEGTDIYVRFVTYNYVTATEEQIARAQRIYSGNETSAYAVVGYTGTLISEVVIPSSIVDEASGKEYDIKKICASPSASQYSFYRNNVITALVIPSTVEHISDVTFGDMSNLRDIYFFGSSTITIGDYAFLNCANLTNIYMSPETTLFDSAGNVITWNNAVFKGCSSITASSFKNINTFEPFNSGEEGGGGN